MKRFWLIPLAAAAVSAGLFLSTARAAPALTLLDSLKATASEQGIVTDVRRAAIEFVIGTGVTVIVGGIAIIDTIIDTDLKVPTQLQ